MDGNSYRKMMEKKDVGEKIITENITRVQEFEQFLIDNSISDMKNASHRNLLQFFTILNLDENERFLYMSSLKSYFMFTKNQRMIRAINLSSGRTTWLDRLSDTLDAEVGEELREEIMTVGGDIKQTSTPKKKAIWTKCMMDCLLANTDDATCKKILTNNLHYKSSNSGIIRKLRTRFKKNHDIDEILTLMHEDWLKRMAKYSGLESEIYRYCENDPSVEAGVRDGNIITVSKIPYKFNAYITATNDQEKHFNYCHCGWVRDSILKSEEEKISSTFCNCSGGWHKQPFEAIFERPLKVELVKSVLRGDDRCTFAVYLEDDLLPLKK
ncbi:MAG: hypothetical protein ACTSPM_12705 [Candidatus Heimdallarchaeota archaeon]